MKLCSKIGCGKIVLARGWCNRHYNQWYREMNREKIRETVRAYRKADPEKRYLADRKRYAANREQVVEKARAYRDANREATRTYHREYQRKLRLADPEKYLERQRQRRRADPDKQRRYKQAGLDTNRAASRRRRARRLSVGIRLYRDQDIFERDRWICHLCHRPVITTLAYPDPWSKSIDHVIPFAYGGTDEPNNVQLAHLQCNMRKGDRVQCG